MTKTLSSMLGSSLYPIFSLNWRIKAGSSWAVYEIFLPLPAIILLNKPQNQFYENYKRQGRVSEIYSQKPSGFVKKTSRIDAVEW